MYQHDQERAEDQQGTDDAPPRRGPYRWSAAATLVGTTAGIALADWLLRISTSPDVARDAAIQFDAATVRPILLGKAFGEAGILPADVDVFAMYDSFTYTVLVVLEDLGFAPKGEGGAFVVDGGGNLRLGGALPTNTDGGGLSSTHPGMRGLFLLCEATRQLRGEAGESQVPGAGIAVAHGSGGWLSTQATVVLGTEPRS